MQKAKTILVAVDAPHPAAKKQPDVVGWAGTLAGALGARLVLLHVAEPEEMAASLKAFAAEYPAPKGETRPAPILGSRDTVGVDMAHLPSWVHDALSEMTTAGASWEARVELARHILGQAVEAAQAAGAKSCETLVKTGDPLPGILEAAEESKADLIVVGAHEGSLLHHLVHRGIADRLLSDSGRPCLVVPGAG